MNSGDALRDVVIVRSPEGVELELPLAGPASRVAAYAIDLIFVVGLVLFVLLFVAVSSVALSPMGKAFQDWIEASTAGDTQLGYRALVLLLSIWLILQYFGELLYFAGFELITRGRTPGKYLMRLRVVGADGQPLSARAVLIRNVLRAVDVLPASYAFGLVAMVTSARGQRLGDHAAGTLVIRTDRLERPPPLRLPPDLRPLALSREQLSRLGEREVALLRATLRRIDTEAGVDPTLADQVAQALTRRLKLEAPAASSVRLLQELLVTVAPEELERAARNSQGP